MKRAKPIVIVLALTALALLLAACSPSAARLTVDGNDAFAKQAYEEALQAYSEAQARSPELAEPYYNAANVLYREGKYGEAIKALQTAAQAAQSDALAQNSFFNAGNSAFNTQGWDAAVESYRQALLRNPDDLDAKYNLELALQQMQQQQEQDQQNQQDQQDQQNQDQQNQDQQNNDQQQDGQGQQDQQDEQSQQNQNQQQDGQGQHDQDQTQDGQGQQDQQDQGQPQDWQGQQGQSPGDQQQQDQQQGQNGQPQNNQRQDGQPQDGSQLAPGQRLTEDQARQLLAAIAGKSDTLQSRLGQFLRVLSRPPVQDW